MSSKTTPLPLHADGFTGTDTGTVTFGAPYALGVVPFEDKGFIAIDTLTVDGKPTGLPSYASTEYISYDLKGIQYLDPHGNPTGAVYTGGGYKVFADVGEAPAFGHRADGTAFTTDKHPMEIGEGRALSGDVTFRPDGTIVDHLKLSAADLTPGAKPGATLGTFDLTVTSKLASVGHTAAGSLLFGGEPGNAAAVFTPSHG